jgi:integrase
MAGANPMWVARQVGNSAQMIFKHYARWIDSADRCREAEKLESVLGQKWGKTQGNSGAS